MIMEDIQQSNNLLFETSTVQEDHKSTNAKGDPIAIADKSLEKSFRCFDFLHNQGGIQSIEESKYLLNQIFQKVTTLIKQPVVE